MTARNFTTFYLAKVDLPVVLEPHKFYVSEARKRLLAQFSDIEREAQEAEAEHLETSGRNFDPDRDDPADAYEDAYQKGVSRWMALTEMQNTITLALTAGMFHQFDKALRDKAVREFSHWLDREKIGPIIWDLGFPRLMELLEWLGMEIVEKDFFRKLDACRQVVNVYKHGDGNAHRDLSSKFPEYYGRFKEEDLPWFRARHEDLTVSEAQFVEFSDAITAFWLNIPEYSFWSQSREAPTWLGLEIKKQEKRLDKMNSTLPARGGRID
ncbi:hypothetical protein [Paraburkholderia haematera]|uniref:Tail assembly chaperone n=1 Tax=Paraburkholderia haematera TaxID=2793077 RepID=A0ABM8RIC2_9BURK|nr:hypothetical protein [Paraburkholderia haematera]CAE6754657.1 hypothetical protein R69888_03125 [Paraburkholderia haematera]